MNLVSSTRQGHVREGHLKGFTLIELLVVIAIIGILAAVVLASLQTARNKGADAAIKSDVDSARAQAELFYNGNGANGYASVCTANAADGTPGIAGMVTGAQGNGATTFCNSNSSAWVLSATLKSASSTSWCTDSTGTSGPRSGNPSGTATNC